MINVAGSEFDFGRVVYAVLADCEHRRRSVTGDEAAELRSIAAETLSDVRRAYADRGGTERYWELVQAEVMDTAVPRYVRAAAAQNAAERSGYGVWRKGDLVARLIFALIGLTIGGAIVAAPFIPIFEDAFAFTIAVGAFVYPDIRRLLTDVRYSRELNAIVAAADQYQRQLRITYVLDAEIEEALRV